MPFKVQTFQKNVELQIEGAVRTELLQACQRYKTLTLPHTEHDPPVAAGQPMLSLGRFKNWLSKMELKENRYEI